MHVQARRKLGCYICKQKGVGVCIQCSSRSCTRGYHVSCGFNQGFTFKMLPAGGKAIQCVSLCSSSKCQAVKISSLLEPAKKGSKVNKHQTPAPYANPKSKERARPDPKPINLVFGNEHRLEEGDKPHYWSVFVRGENNSSDLHQVDKVTFYLHPDFRPSEVHVSKPPFQISRRGWGAFEMDIDIHLQDGTLQEVTHYLNFDDDLTSQQIRIGQPQPSQRNESKPKPQSKSTPGPKPKHALHYGNQYIPLDEDSEEPHEWTVFVRGSDPLSKSSERCGVDRVTFHLHPDFKPSMIHVNKPPFQITRKGWGAFDIPIDILMQDGTTHEVTHDLMFDQDITFTSLKFNASDKAKPKRAPIAHTPASQRKHKGESESKKRKFSSTPSTGKHQLICGNEHIELDEDDDAPHEWTVFVRGSDPLSKTSDRVGVDEVTFYLHPDFKPSIVKVTKPPFQVTRKGWGAFEMEIDITMQDGSTKRVLHDLNFDEDISYNPVKLSKPGAPKEKKSSPGEVVPTSKKRKLAISGKLTYGNLYKELDDADKPHQWTVFVRGSDAAKSKERFGIDRVIFYLHADFKPNVVTVEKPPFQIVRRGWGAFEMDIDIIMLDGSTKQVTHELDFDQEISYKSLKL